MLRSAAKNHEFVLPVVDPTDYPKVLDLLRRNELTPAVRREFAAKVFAHTADYDAAIAGYLTPHEEGLPRRLGIAMERAQALRYGENPGQRAALYVTEEPRGMRDLTQRQGKELSFNNLLDIDAAMWAVACWSNRPACGVIKHTTPCGIAVAGTAVEAFRKARATDPVSAFGSVIAFNTVVDRATAQAMSDLFVEVVVAPSFHDEALAVFAAKKPLRVVELPVSRGTGSLDFKRVRGGFLVQDQFQFDPSDQGWTVATDRQPTEREWNDLRFAWAAVASVKSNAILLARDEAAIGIGAGQMSRVDSAFLAVHKARQAGPRPGRHRAGLRRLLPLRRRRRAGGRGRRHRHHPAGRLGARRRSHRGRQPPRHRHGDDRPPPVPTLASGLYDRDQRRNGRRISGRWPRSSSSLRSTSSRWRRRRRSGTPRSTSRPPRCSASRIRRAIRSSSSWRTRFGLLPLAAVVRGADQPVRGATSAAAAGLWFLVAERWLRGIVPVRWARYAAAFGGVLVGATSWTVWNQTTVNEKVYTVSLLSIALVMWLVVRWGDDEPGPHRDRWLVLIAYVLALTSTNHLMGVLALPALLVYVLWTDWRALTRPWAIVTFYALLLAVSGKWIDMLQPGSAEGGSFWSLSLAVAGYALWRSPKDPLVYLGIARGRGRHLAQLSLAADARGAVPADQRGRADRLLQPGAAGRAEPGAVRQAGAHASGRRPSPASSATSGSTSPGSSPATGAGSPASPPRSSPCSA